MGGWHDWLCGRLNGVPPGGERRIRIEWGCGGNGGCGNGGDDGGGWCLWQAAAGGLSARNWGKAW